MPDTSADSDETVEQTCSGVSRVNGMLPRQSEFEEGGEYLLPTSMVYRAEGGEGERYSAVHIKVIEKNIRVNESTHRIAEGIDET